MSIVTDANEDERFFRLQPMPCVEVAANGAILRANASFCALSGRSEEELQACGLVTIVSQVTQDDVERMFSLAGVEDVLTFEAPLCRPSGELLWVEWRGVRMPLRGGVRFLAYDVTKSRSAVEVSREGERFLSTLLSNLPGMAYRCKNDPKWTMEFISAGVEPLTGHPVEEFVPKQAVTFGDLIHPEDTGRVWETVQEALNNRVPFSVKYRIRTKSGEIRWCQEYGRGVYAHDELLALEGFIADITDRVQVESELREQLALIEAQQNQIADLSLPIIEVWDGVLTLPVVGVLDAARAGRIMEGLLSAVVRTQSEHVIVDLTAVELVDAEVAEHLVSILRAVQLLGARGILSGIRPGAARSLVGLSTDLGNIPTTSDLRSALRSCMKATSNRGSSRGR